MNNILLVEKYLIEVKSSIKNLITECENYNIHHDYIKGLLDYIVLVNGDDIKAEEVLDLIYCQLPELYHHKQVMDIVNNLIQLFNGDLNNIFDFDDNKAKEFIFMAKNILNEEIFRLEKLYDLHDKDDNSDNILDYFENININPDN